MSDKLQRHHLERKAILYIRQSSVHQVLHNRESGLGGDREGVAGIARRRGGAHGSCGPESWQSRWSGSPGWRLAVLCRTVRSVSENILATPS